MSEQAATLFAAIAWGGLWACLGGVLGWAAHGELTRRSDR